MLWTKSKEEFSIRKVERILRTENVNHMVASLAFVPYWHQDDDDEEVVVVVDELNDWVLVEVVGVVENRVVDLAKLHQD